MATREIPQPVDWPADWPDDRPTDRAAAALPCAASSLVATLLDRDPTPFREVARTSVSVHFETGDAEVPVLCLCTPRAIRLPNSVVTAELPGAGPLLVGGGSLRSEDRTWVPRRWWSPPCPRGLHRPDSALVVASLASVAARARPLGVRLPHPSYDGLVPAVLIGAGPGLTPAGDDVLAGALVAAHAVADARTPAWVRDTRAALAARRTTAVSRAMLHHALDGYATPELAAFLEALCSDGELTAPMERLLAVGHTSGGALLTGVLHTLTTRARVVEPPRPVEPPRVVEPVETTPPRRTRGAA